MAAIRRPDITTWIAWQRRRREGWTLYHRRRPGEDQTACNKPIPRIRHKTSERFSKPGFDVCKICGGR